MSELNTVRLRLARERLGKNQIELSKLLGTAPGLVGQWERGDKEPSLKKLKQLAKALDVRVGWLLDDHEGDLTLASTQSVGNSRRRSDQYDSREAVLADYQAPAGLRDLANDGGLVTALGIDAREWSALGSCAFYDGLTKDGYCAALMILRTCAIEARRRELGGKPGRHVAAAVDETQYAS
ncbi:helix-turn-helix transcriptional regulator [uncultured Thiodictyon sp.]|uniref:helix-turn-helix domain-containing protein n=1 Tax=uncultured Thiodictyon sp. TaxID=1846217 RepID=UPI0025E9F61D|nr:helix-turn-helix transcriptional regulator [uncultured Thiodictyon sp.]